jgi:hypothetical protein
MGCVGVVGQAVIRLKIGIANALKICRSEAERLATDGRRSAREGDGVPSETRVTGANVELFVHSDERSVLKRRCSDGVDGAGNT